MGTEDNLEEAPVTSDEEGHVAPAGQQIDKIREIIFGGQMRDYEARFAQMERDFGERLQRQHEEFAARLEHLERSLTSAIGELREALAAETRRRDGERDQAERTLAERERALNEQIQSAASASADEAGDLRALLERNSAELNDALLTLSERLDRALAQASSELEDAKVSRDDLAVLLSDVARRLRREDAQA